MKNIKTQKEKRAAIQKESEDLMNTIGERAITKEERAKFDDIEKRFNEVDDEIAILETAEKRSKRLAADTIPTQRENTDSKDAEQRAAFIKYMKGGDLSTEERAVIAGVNGQVLIPKTISDRVEIALKERGELLGAVTTITTESGNEITIPTLNAADSRAMVVDEYDESGKEGKTFGKVTLGAYTYRTPIIPLSVELLDDAAVDVEGIIVEALVESILNGLCEDTTNGDGNKKIKGFIKDAPVGVTAGTDAITYDDIVDLMKSVKRPNSGKKVSAFVGNSNTQAELLKIKDTTGRPIFTQSAIDGEPDKVLGRPFLMVEDMEDIGTGKVSLAFGNFRKYYLRLVKGIRVKKFNELLGAHLAIGIMGYFRADGKLADAGTNPVKTLKHA